MTSRERFLTAMSLETPDRVPRAVVGLTPMANETFVKNAGNADLVDYFKADIRGIGYVPTAKKYDYMKYYERRGLDLEMMTIDEYGVGHIKSRNTNLHYTHFTSPLKNSTNLNDFIDYPLPDFNEPYRSQNFAKDTTDIHAKGLAVSGHMEMTLFEKAWQIRGFDEFMMDMYENPDIVNCLLDRLFELRVKGAELFAKADVDVIFLGDDVSMQTGMLMSPEIWRSYFKPRMAKIIETAKRFKPSVHIAYHSDGNPSEIYDELLDIGVTILNPIQPECVDPAIVKQKYGNRAAFWGAIGIQHTLPFGSVEDIRNEVKLRMRTIGKNGGYIIAPTHVIAPEVPWKNLKGLYDAIDEFGSYV